MPAAPTVPPPSGAFPPASTLTRRSALKWGALAAGVAAAVSVAGCADTGNDDRDDEPDPLLTPLAAARRDAAAATALVAVAPERAGALGVIAAERTEHADALAAEVARAAGQDLASASSSTTAAATTPPTAPPTVDELRGMLAESQRGAATLARRLDGYRAGLLGSISAAVAAQQAVLLL